MICEFIKTRNDINNGQGVGIGDFEYKQQTTFKGMQIEMIASNQVISKAIGHQSSKTYDIAVTYNGETLTLKTFTPGNNITGKFETLKMFGKMAMEGSFNAAHETLSPKIYDASGSEIGEFTYIPVSDGALQSYNYYRLMLNGVELNCYMVGHDRKDIMFCMYNNQNQMVATVSKNMIVKNGKARYTMYMKNDEWFRYVNVATILLHEREFDGDKGGSVSNCMNTHQKGLLEKYNPTYIDEVRAMTCPENLPENMPLVLETVKKSQKTFGIILLKIFVFGLTAIVAGIVIYTMINSK